MFLKKSKKTYKGKVYETYALTESYREGGKVKHKHITNLGVLTPEQADKIRKVLKTIQLEDAFVGHLSDVVARNHYKFLDVAVLDDIWKKFGLDQFFSQLPYTEAMTINRCLNPRTKINIKQWIENTALPRLQGSELPEEYDVYRTLDKIADREADLQKHLYRKYINLGLRAKNTVIYDITSSYFEGTKCILASHGYSRDHRPDRQQVVIALVITPEGYPLYWQVLPGNTQDITTVKDLVSILKERFGIDKCLLVFDRGMVSSENLAAISGQDLTYVSALDKDEIRNLAFLDQDSFDFSREHWQEELLALGFNAYDKNLYYREYTWNKKRYIIAFSYNLHQEQKQLRQKHLQKVKDFLDSCNNELQNAQRSRNREKTEEKIKHYLKKHKMHKIFAWELEPIIVKVNTAKGQRMVNSFQIVYSIDEARLKEESLLDGITCFVTNESPEDLSSRQVISQYRRKDKTEEAFQEIKSYLRLRPFHLTREKRVKAHVSICVLGYLLFNSLEQKLKQAEQSLSAPAALELLGNCQINQISPKDSETYVESITELTKEQAELLKSLNLEHLTWKRSLSKLLEHSTM